MKRSILILGGTAEARRLAGHLADNGCYAVELSLAGRTRAPVAHPVPVRIGGFGGAEGLAQYLRASGVDLLVDATHPYAARISQNAAAAAERAEVPLLALRRAAWERQNGDRWREVDSVAAAVDALGEKPRNVFLTLGRQDLLPFETAPQHKYLVRSVDPVDPPLNLPTVRYMTDRGPFVEADERLLLETQAIDAIVAKNSGGTASLAKITAARALGIEVVLIRRPDLPDVASVGSVEEALAGIAHLLPPR